MLEDKNGELRVRCLLDEYHETAESFRHTYETIWQSGIVFATISLAIFGFFFSFQNQLKLYLPYLPFISLLSIVIWWLMVFEPMNHYGDVREKRCITIETELSGLIPDLNMSNFRDYGASKIRFLRVRWGVRVLVVIILTLMILLLLSFFFPSILHLGSSGNQTST
jgi:hypothetical protein